MNEDESKEEKTVNAPTDKEYTDIINSDSEKDPKFLTEQGQPAKITYYCRECKKLVAAKRIEKKLSFKCEECGKNEVSFGTEESIKNFYNIK